MRISDNTAVGSVREALNRTRGRMEKLQIQNAHQKKMLGPSDDPAGNSKIMSMRTDSTINSQFESNASLGKNRLTMTDNALSEVYDIFVRAKEIALSQSSDASASWDSRQAVAQEVSSLYQQLVAVANKRVGNYYLFGGFKTQSAPYTASGEYKGDMGEMPIEIQKDVFVTVNVPGPNVFEIKNYRPESRAFSPDAIDHTNAGRIVEEEGARPPVEQGVASPQEVINSFQELDTLRVGLMTNDSLTIRDTLERFDEMIRSVVSLRAKISARVSSMNTAIEFTQKSDVENAALISQLEDADYAELWSNLAKEETVLRSSLQAAQKLIQPTLLEFFR